MKVQSAQYGFTPFPSGRSGDGPIVILGAAESGAGAAVLARKQGLDVFVSDGGPIAEKYKTQLNKYGIAFEEGNHTEEKILSAAEVIKSPGIPDKAAIVQKVRQKNIP